MRTPKIEVYRVCTECLWDDCPDAKIGDLRWRLRAANGRVIAQSSEGYRRIRDLTRSIEITWPGAFVDDGAGEGWWLFFYNHNRAADSIPITVPVGVSLHSRRQS